MRKSSSTSHLDYDGSSNAKQARSSDYRFDAIFTLQHICSVKFSTTLWSCQRSREIIKSSYANSSPQKRVYSRENELWGQIDNRIKEILFSLELPQLINKMLSRYVKAVGLELFRWIEYQDVNIFQIHESFPKAYNFIDHVTWTKRGTIDCERTARSLFHDTALIPQERYIIACTYCFEDEVYKIGPSVIHEYDFKKIGLSKYPLIHYWTLILLSHPPPIGLFRFISNRGNKMNSSAVKVIGKLGDEYFGCVKYLKNGTLRDWMKQPDLEIQHAMRTSLYIPYNVMHSTLGFILQNFIHNFLWEDYYLSTMYHYRNLMGKIPFLTAINALVERIQTCDNESYDKYVGIFEEVWNFMPQALKMYLLRPQSTSLTLNILLGLNWDKHFHIVEMLLADKSVIYIQQLIFSKSMYKIFLKLFERNQFEKFIKVIDLCLTTESDKSKLKKIFSKKMSIEIISLHFIKNNNVAQLNEILKWIFKSDAEIRRVKDDILPNIVRLIVRNVFLNAPTEELRTGIFENFLMWHFESNVDQVENFKMRLTQDMVCNLITSEIMQYRSSNVRNLMHWLFNYNQIEIEKFKKEKARFKIAQIL